MAQMNISLPDKLKSWAEQRVAEGDYSSTSDYVRDLMRRDQKRSGLEAREAHEIERLRCAWDEGVASGPAVEGNFDPAEIAERGMARRNT